MWPWQQKRRPEGPSYIGPDVQIVGRIESAGELTIDGRVEGDIIHEGRLVIGAGADVVSNIRATSLQVAGTVRGNLQVAETLELLATARLQGDIACMALQVAQGAVFSGTNHMAGTELVPAAAPVLVQRAVEPVAAPLAILLEPVGIEEREVLGVVERVAPPAAKAVAGAAGPAPVAPVPVAPAPVAPVPVAPAPVAPVPVAPAPGARGEAPAFYGGFAPAFRSEAS